jgi:hypothetical protein
MPTATDSRPVAEEPLCAVWRTQRYDRAALRTTAGASLEVVYPGSRQRTGGPDFAGAILTVAGFPCPGDVEVHVRSSDWDRHGHGHDRRYSHVVLHVVLDDDADVPPRRPGGAVLPQLSLAGRLPAGWDDGAADVGPDRCRRRVDAIIDSDLAAWLDALGDARLLVRAEALAADIDTVGADQACYRRLLDALGYSHNRRPFRALADVAPYFVVQAAAARLRDPDRVLCLEALLIGAAGLLPSQRARTRRQPAAAQDWVDRSYADELEAIWAEECRRWYFEPLNADDWTFAVRPVAWPPRRIGAAALLLAGTLDSGLAASILGAIAPDGRGAPGEDGRATIRRLVERLRCASDASYWASHHDFGRALGGQRTGDGAGGSLLGLERALAIAVNVALPFALATALASGDERLAAAVRLAFAAAPPLAPDHIVRQLAADVLGPDRARLARSARRQQGLHHLFRRGCSIASCARCPLREAPGG